MNRPFRSLDNRRRATTAWALSSSVLATKERATSEGHKVSLAAGGKRLTRVQVGILIFLLWTAVGIFEFLPEMLIASPWAVFLDKMFDAWTWALLTPALMLLDRKLAARQTSVTRVILIYILLSVPFTLVHTYLVAALLYPFPQVVWDPFRDPKFAIYFFLGGWSTYAAIVGALEAFRFYNRYLIGRLHLERVERSLLQSRLQVLRLHLEPHFLFNALNSVSSELDSNPKLAREMISDLGALLRQSLNCQDKSVISLASELVLLDRYLSIQKVRFRDRMHVEIDVEPETLSAEVPSMLLQPLIENAIRHGIEKKRSGGRIKLSASAVGDELRLTVFDNGPGLPRDWRLESSTGHGLRVTAERLAALYPDYASNCFSIGSRQSGGTQVILRMPLKPMTRDGLSA